MIQDSETDLVYFSALLPKLYPEFFTGLKSILDKHKVNYAFLANTKDIWCRDYMPVQVADNEFIQFVYNPSYLQGKKYRHLQSDPKEITVSLNYNITDSKLRLDGGNVVKSKNKAIITSRVFKENTDLTKENLLRKVKEILSVKQVIIVPEQPYDFTGHADGLIRFVNEDTVIINSFSAYKLYFKNALLKVLKDNNLNYYELEYAPSEERNKYGDFTAKGCYINYLQVKNLFLIPQFGLPEDENAYKTISQIFPNYKIEKINCNVIAQNGGILNCISWNIKTNE